MFIKIVFFIIVITCIHSQIEYFTGGYRNANYHTLHRKHNRCIWDSDDSVYNSKTIK